MYGRHCLSSRGVCNAWSVVSAVVGGKSVKVSKAVVCLTPMSCPRLDLRRDSTWLRNWKGSPQQSTLSYKTCLAYTSGETMRVVWLLRAVHWRSFCAAHEARMAYGFEIQTKWKYFQPSAHCTHKDLNLSLWSTPCALVFMVGQDGQKQMQVVACQPRWVVKAAGKKLADDGKWNEVCWILGRRKTRDWTNKSAFSWHGNSSLCKQECRFLCCNGFSSLLPMPLWFLGFCIPLPQSPSKLSESTLVRRARMPQMPPSLLEVS